MKKSAKKAPKAVAKPARKAAPKAATPARKVKAPAKAVAKAPVKSPVKAPVVKAPAKAAAVERAPVVTQASTVTTAASKPADRAEASKAFAVEVAKRAVLDRCSDVRVLDVRGLSPVTDFLVLATGTSGRQMRSAAEDAVVLGKQTGYAPLSSSGLEGETWICVDFVDVLFHVFNPESRGYYDLESLWGDAKRVEV